MMLLRWPFILAAVLLTGCSGRVTDSAATASDTIQSLAQQSSLSLISNSTASQLTCATTNTIVLQIALSNLSTFYCRDLSKLMTSVHEGPVCDGGVTVSKFPVNSNTVNCQQVTVCGQAPTSSSVVAQRIDGTPVRQLTFANLPWGCDVRVEASTDQDFDPAKTQVAAAQILPPTCPFCASQGKVTCQTCTAVDPNNFLIIAGQVIPKTCGGACATCTAAGQTFNHGDTFPFYTTSNSGCAQTCAQVQVTRVCNNGTWTPGTDPSFVTQCQQPPPANCTPPSSFTSAFLNQIRVLTGTSRPRAQLDGTPATCASCQAGNCATCTTSNGSAGYMLYKQTSVPAGQSCSTIGLCEACVGGLFQGDPNYKYPQCATLGSPCSATATGGPVSTGATFTFYNNTQTGCAKTDLTCTDGLWYDAGGANVSQTTVNTYGATCVMPTDCVTQGGIKIKNGQSSYVFAKEEVDATDTCYAANNFATLSCNKGTIAPADPGPTFRYAACDYKKCKDPSDPTGVRTITANRTMTYFKKSEGSCTNGDALADCNANKVTIACGVSGGTAVVTPSISDFTAYTYGTCSVPPSCSQCQVITQDKGPIRWNVNTVATFFKQPTAQYCSSIGAAFTCKPGVNNGPPTISGEAGALPANYPYYDCSGSGGDQGDGGGTGGGTGNDSGPGSAIKKRIGAGDGGPGGGGGCIDAATCPSDISKASPPTSTKFIPCLLPWGLGEMEFYGAVNAFSATGLTMASGQPDTVCVVKPDKCSNHRQLRTCHSPKLSGAAEYKYPNCVEKDTCP